MRPRINSPALTVPGVMDALQALSTSAIAAAEKAGVSRATLELINFRASQINGCAVCLDMHARSLAKFGESPERLATVAAWREAPYFTEAERATLGLTEAATRISDRPNAVPEEVWNEAVRHFDEAALSTLVVAIAGINAWNRLNVSTGQIAGEWTAQWAA